MPTDPQVRDQLAHDHDRLHHLQGLIPALRRSWQRAKAAGIHPLAERRHGTLQGAVDAARHDEALIRKLTAELERIDDNIRGRIVQAAHRALTEKAAYRYAEIRPYPHSLFGSSPRRMDCSGFLTLAYKEGGAQDPNHLDYNGQGYTGTLIDHAIKQPHPLLADVCFYGDQGGGVPVHVTIHVGNGLVISMGSPGDPSIGPAEQMGPSGFRGYWTFPSVIPRVTPLPAPAKAPAAKPVPARKPAGHHLPAIHHPPARREIHHGGPDVYAGDGTVNWRQVAHSGHDVGICKATEGTTFTDPALGRNARGIKAAGLIRGFYHFAHPSNNPAAEAWHFLRTIAGVVGDEDRLILDIEVSDGQGEAHIRGWVHDFLTVLAHQHPHNEQWVYTSSLFIAWDRHPDRRYWVADYSPRLIVPAGVDRHQIVLWQRSDHGHVPGVPGACDVNILPS